MLSVHDYLKWEEQSAGITSLEGLSRSRVRSAMCAAQKVAQGEPGPVTEDAWRQWYNVYLQMLWDDIEICPAGYWWEPVSLTC